MSFLSPSSSSASLPTSPPGSPHYRYPSTRELTAKNTHHNSLPYSLSSRFQLLPKESHRDISKSHHNIHDKSPEKDKHSEDEGKGKGKKEKKDSSRLQVRPPSITVPEVCILPLRA